jgi:hypothetical protein
MSVIDLFKLSGKVAVVTGGALFLPPTPLPTLRALICPWMEECRHGESMKQSQCVICA